MISTYFHIKNIVEAKGVKTRRKNVVINFFWILQILMSVIERRGFILVHSVFEKKNTHTHTQYESFFNNTHRFQYNRKFEH